MNSAQRTLDFAVDNERAVGDENGVVLRPNWNADGESIVYEVKDEDGSKLCFVRSDGSVSVPLAVCNEGASRVHGRAAFFAQDDFAFVSDPGGRLAIWRCELQAQRVSQLIAPRRVLATKAPVRGKGSGRFPALSHRAGIEDSLCLVGPRRPYRRRCRTRHAGGQPALVRSRNERLLVPFGSRRHRRRVSAVCAACRHGRAVRRGGHRHVVHHAISVAGRAAHRVHALRRRRESAPRHARRRITIAAIDLRRRALDVSGLEPGRQPDRSRPRRADREATHGPPDGAHAGATLTRCRREPTHHRLCIPPGVIHAELEVTSHPSARAEPARSHSGGQRDGARRPRAAPARSWVRCSATRP